MSEEPKSAAAPEITPMQHALIHWLAGICFAIILTTLIVFVGPHLWGVSALLKEFNLQGIDTQMSLEEYFWPPKISEPGYVFLDVDPDYCRRTTKTRSDFCAGQSPALPSTLISATAAILPARPSVIIIDGRLWGYDDDPEVRDFKIDDLVKNVRAAPVTRIISVAPAYPSQSGDMPIWKLLPDKVRRAPIQFAWAFAKIDEDGVGRTYPAFARETALSGLPTMPFLASLYQGAAGDQSKLHAVDCRYGLVVPSPPLCNKPIAGPARTYVDKAVLTARSENPDSRMKFTLPSIAPPMTDEERLADPDSDRNDWDRYFDGAYNVMVASQAIDQTDHVTNAAAAIMRNKVVVVGTNVESALDEHATPLGPMSGPEYVLNAVKAFHDKAFFSQKSEITRLELELAIILLSSAPFFGFWWVYYRKLELWRSRRNLAELRPLIVATLFLAAGAIAMTLAGIVTVVSGYTLSYLVPVFSLSLEGFAECARWTNERIEDKIGRIIFFFRN